MADRSEAERKRLRYPRLVDFSISVEHDGDCWKVYYYPISSFEPNLGKFSKFLEVVKESGEKVSAIIPNTGIVPTSMVLGTSFQGVKGFAVVTRKES